MIRPSLGGFPGRGRSPGPKDFQDPHGRCLRRRHQLQREAVRAALAEEERKAEKVPLKRRWILQGYWDTHYGLYDNRQLFFQGLPSTSNRVPCLETHWMILVNHIFIGQEFKTRRTT